MERAEHLTTPRIAVGPRADGRPVPKVSVLTVVRNGQATLARAIESVVSQIDEQSEYIIVDGASTDGTIDIIRAHADRLACWISEPDRGIYDAMNKALSLARGDWVIFLGADDVLKPVLGAVMRELSDPRAVYYGNVEIEATSRMSGGRFNRYRLMQENICHQAIFYPRSVYEVKRYDTDVGMLADHKYNIELWGGGTRFVHLPYVVSRFNDAGASSSAQAAFHPIKMATIRASFGPFSYAVKLARNSLVRVVKGQRGPA